MKTYQSTSKCANASMKQAIKVSKHLTMLLDSLNQTIQFSSAKVPILMPKIRKELAELNQRVHEANAYYNVLDTE